MSKNPITHGHYVAGLFGPGGAASKKQLEKAGFTHMYDEALCGSPFEPPTEALPRWVSQKGLPQNPHHTCVLLCGYKFSTQLEQLRWHHAVSSLKNVWYFHLTLSGNDPVVINHKGLVKCNSKTATVLLVISEINN